MGTEITESEAVIGELKRVSVGGQKLRVPISPTLRFMFAHRKAVAKIADGGFTDDDVDDYFDALLTFLRRYNPKFDEDKILDEVQLTDLFGFYQRWFGSDREDEGDERPPRQRRGTTGPKRTTSRSRS